MKFLRGGILFSCSSLDDDGRVFILLAASCVENQVGRVVVLRPPKRLLVASSVGTFVYTRKKGTVYIFLLLLVVV